MVVVVTVQEVRRSLVAAVRLLLCLLRSPWPDWAGLGWAGLGWAGPGWDLLTLQRAALALPWHLGRGGITGEDVSS